MSDPDVVLPLMDAALEADEELAADVNFTVDFWQSHHGRRPYWTFFSQETEFAEIKPWLWRGETEKILSSSR